MRKLLVLVLACLANLCWAEPSARDSLARLPGGGAGVIISSDGLVSVPTSLAVSGPVMIGSDKVPAKVTHHNKKAPFALMRVRGGPYPTLSLGDCSLLHPGQEVTVWTPGGTRAIKVRHQSTDVSDNLQYLTLELPFEESFQGWPVLNSAGEAVAFLSGPEPGRPESCRAVSAQELKLFLFNEGLPPLSRGPSGSSEPSSLKVIEWEFPLQAGGPQRMGEILDLNRWRLAFGMQGAQIAPLLVDSNKRLFLATYTGTIYCLDVDKQIMLWRGELGSGGIVTAAPQLAGDRLLVSQGQFSAHRANNTIILNSGKTFALSAKTSEELWTFPTRFPSPPLLRGNVMLVSGLGLLGAVDLASGKYFWYRDQAPRGKRALWISLQATRGDIAYGIRVPVELHGGADSREPLHLKSDDDFELIAINIKDGKEIWSTKLRDTSDTTQPLGPKLSLNGDRLSAILPKKLVTVEASSGKLLSTVTRTERALADQLTVREETMYAGDSNGWYAVGLSDGQRLWSCPGPASEAAPIWHKGVVYGASHHSLTAIDADDGRVLWSHTFPHRISGQPTIQEHYLYAASMEGWIYRLDLDPTHADTKSR